MKKYLMMTLAAALVVSCSKMDDYSMTQSEIDQAKYEAAFINHFGNPASNQDWGFGSTSSAPAFTRATVASPSVTLVGQTYNSFMAESYASAMTLAQNWVNAGWRSSIDYDDSRYVVAKTWHNSNWTDRYYQINASVVASDITSDLQAKYNEAVLKQVPESVNNISKATSTGYSLTTKGGEVTVTPIYHNSNSNDKVSYYYYPAGSTPDVKSLPKYTIGQLGNEDAMLKKHSLVYVDGSGNASYTFPANYVICFVVANMSGASNNVNVLTKGAGDTEEVTVSYPSAPEYYGDGDYNQEIHTVNGWNYTPTTTSHAAVFSTSDISFVGFEDWNDMDYNDLIFAVGGTTGGGDIVIEDNPDPDPDPDPDFTPVIRVMAEDLCASEGSDFDFNDVVFDVMWIDGGARIRVVAAGGTLPLKVGGEEVHGKFGVSTSTMVNTINGQKSAYPYVIFDISGSFNNDANNIPVQVYKNDEWQTLTAVKGKVASKIGVDPNVDWADEWQDIDEKWNGQFSEWVQGKRATFY